MSLRSPRAEAPDLKSVKSQFESERRQRKYFSISGIEIFPNERDKLWLDWTDWIKEQREKGKHYRLSQMLDIYPP